MKVIYLIRHCKAGGQEPGACLADEGVLQAKQLVKFFADKRIDYMVSSPFERAISTMRPLAQELNLKIHTDPRLSERILSSESIDHWMDRLKESFIDFDIKLPGGESSREAMNRGLAVIDELMERPESNIAVVTHGNLMALILMHFRNDNGLGVWGQLTNPDVYQLIIPEGNASIKVRRVWGSPKIRL